MPYLLGGTFLVIFSCGFFFVILQIGTCKNVATKHTIPQNTENFGFLGSKYQIIRGESLSLVHPCLLVSQLVSQSANAK